MVRKLGKPLTQAQTQLNTEFPSGGTFHLWLLYDQRTEIVLAPGNVNTTSNEITVAGHDFLVDTPIEFTGATPPVTGLTTYWVKTVAGNVITLSETKGGATLDLTTAGSGTFTVRDKELSFDTDTNYSLLQVERKEVNYQGLATRPVFTPPTDKPIDASNNRVFFTASTALNNSSDADLIQYDTVAIVQGGNATPGNTTGTLLRLMDMGGVVQVPGNASRNLPITLEYAN